MSPRAGRIALPMVAVVGLTFFSFIAHTFMLGASAFPGGKHIGGRYLVEEHGRTIELTAQQFWASYLHGVLMVCVFAAAGITILVLYSKGDLRDEWRDK
ncbi:hypothetical protein [Prosthecobacter sp.]|uniref:hypothetical protein n=1 Tax=Prosthecobacter sp. TaxID=1965333 RepID=UPI003783F086